MSSTFDSVRGSDCGLVARDTLRLAHYYDRADLRVCYNCQYCSWKYTIFASRMAQHECSYHNEDVSPTGCCREFVREPDR